MLPVRVTPRAGRDEVEGWRGEELAVRVTTAPEGGKANARVCEVVAAKLGIPKSTVRVVRGHSSRHKVLEVLTMDDEQLASSLGRSQDAK